MFPNHVSQLIFSSPHQDYLETFQVHDVAHRRDLSLSTNIIVEIKQVALCVHLRVQQISMFDSGKC